MERRFGWDCHGLPVEFEIDKTLNIKSPEDVAKLGIDKYNAECRKIVTRYVKEWEEIVGRIGRWIGECEFFGCVLIKKKRNSALTKKFFSWNAWKLINKIF